MSIILNGEIIDGDETYGLQKIDGFLSLLKKDVVFEEPVSSGDSVSVFALTGDKSLLTKDPEGIKIKAINSVYILFETEINIKEG